MIDFLFLLISLFSFLFLILGLVSPKIVNKVIKKDFDRKTILKVFGSSLVIFFIASVITMSPDGESNNISNKIEQENINILSSIDYNIASEEDISYSNAKRYNFRVVIKNNPATKEQVKAISEKIVKDNESKADALAIFYYYDKDQIDGAYTLAKAEWAPNGDWSQAEIGKNQKLTYSFTNLIDVERTNIPTELEREINTAMKDKWYELTETSSDTVSDEDVAEILAPQYNKTVEEMMQIRQKVTSYDLGY